MKAAALAIAGIAGIASPLTAQTLTPLDSILGRAGAAQAGGVIRYGFPRSDLHVTVNGVTLRPAFALGSWVAFKGSGAETMAMGDLVLLEREVARVMKALQSGGVQQTALHNHLIGESPRVMYMHIEAHGDERAIASTIHRALGLTRTPLGAPSTGATPSLDLDTAAIASALGYHGKATGGVYQIGVPRADAVTENGMEIPPSMGVATAINFQTAGRGKAAVTGDFVMTADEVNKVIRALQANGIQPTALHSHMIGESPRLFFMHFWGDANAVALAKGLRAALNEMNVKK